MNAEIKQKWVAALRSGKYEQGTQYLKRDMAFGTQYCCLGVLCEMAQADGVVEEGAVVNGVHKFGNERNGLPVEVQKWAGIDGRLGRFTLGSEFSFLSDLNDSGLPFSIIAGFIEEKF